MDADADDVAATLAGDLAAFERIVRRWQGPLVTLAWRFCRQREQAEEMAQEAFLKTYRALASWRRDAPFSTWLFALATNLYRSRARRLAPEFVELDEGADDPQEHGPDAEIAQRELNDAVRTAVARLPSKYRDALILYYFHSMGVAEAAASLGLREGTLKARLLRGRKLLRKRLSAILPAVER